MLQSAVAPCLASLVVRRDSDVTAMAPNPSVNTPAHILSHLNKKMFNGAFALETYHLSVGTATSLIEETTVWRLLSLLGRRGPPPRPPYQKKAESWSEPASSPRRPSP